MIRVLVALLSSVGFLFISSDVFAISSTTAKQCVTSNSPIGVDQLNGDYAFQLTGVTNFYGYYDNNGNLLSLKQGASCPKNTVCNNYSGSSVSYGVINFDGKSTATFISFNKLDGSGNGGGPKAGSKYRYALKHGQISLIIKPGTGTGPTLTLGNFNCDGIAGTVFIRSLPGDYEASFGTAILQ